MNTLKILEIEKLFLILSDQISNCFYIFRGSIIVPYWTLNSLRICPIVPNLKVRLWVSKHDHPWMRVFVDISLVP